MGDTSTNGDAMNNSTGETIPSALAGERLDRVVSMVTGVSRSEAAALVARGAVELDGVAVTVGSHRVRQGQRLGLPDVVDPGTVGPRPDSTVVIDVVYDDDDVIVVDKQAGLVVHPGAGNAEGTLVNGLLASYPELEGVGEDQRPGIVHRLDKETSGLMVVARTPTAYERLVEALASHRVERTYLALVWGLFDSPRGIVDAPIGRSARTRTKMAVSVGGREARTGYEVVSAFSEPADTSLVECRLETGRTHQIRVHMAAIGHPVVGDQTYRGTREVLDVPRMFLHSRSLGFDHPVTGKPMTFESPLPVDLERILTGLR